MSFAIRRIAIGLSVFVMLEAAPALAATSAGIDTPTNTHSMPLAVEGTAIMTLTDTPGNYVGIGTTSPTEPLEVAGVVQIHDVGVSPDNGYNGALRITRTDASGQYINLVRSGVYGWSIGTAYNSNIFGIGVIAADDTTFVPSFIIMPGGNVGIGTTAAATTLYINGVTTMAGAINRAGAATGYLNGQYSAGGETAATSGVIYSIGGSYVPTASSLGNMYGIGYGYSGNAGISFGGLPANNWGMYVASGGTPRIFLSSDTGTVYSTNIVLPTGGGGITFPDGTRQTTAAVPNHAFGGAWGQLQSGACDWPNAITGGCSCPAGTSSHQIGIGYQGSGYNYMYVCY